jgi:hypothetical protein
LGSDRAFGVYYASRMKDVKPEMRQASGF